MKMILVLVCLLLPASDASAQWRLRDRFRLRQFAEVPVPVETCSISLYCPPMKIVAAGLKLRKADAEPMIATITWADGTKTTIKPVTIPPTFVDKIGVGHWRVRACQGTTSRFPPAPQPQLTVNLPPEDVFLDYDSTEKKFAMYAQPIDCLTVLMMLDGSIWRGTIHFDVCEADFVSLTVNVAEETTAKGTLTKGR